MSLRRDTALIDTLSRPLRSLRVSVTDRCNLRCQYCMPEEDYVWIPRKDLLTFEEMDNLVALLVEQGVERLRLTGGEPLLRRDLAALIKMFAARSELRDLSLTTNGILLANSAQELADAGLHRITVSLDTLQPERFKSLTRRDDLGAVLRGIEAARATGLARLKINTVVMRGFNDDELVDLIEFGKSVEAEVRFIEYMDVGGATGWSPQQVVSRREVLEVLGRHYGTIETAQREDRAPAERFVLPDSTRFGIVSSTTAPFCSSCDRSRLTADGLWYLCLYAEEGIDLKSPLRNGASAEAISSLIASAWRRRADHGAEDRLALVDRSALVSASTLREKHHLEMHTRGG